MGMQDRDWYRDHLKEKEKSNADKRYRPIEELFEKPVFRRHSSPWHWSLIVVFWVFVIIALAFAFRLTRY